MNLSILCSEWEPKGDPKILKNPPKTQKVLQKWFPGGPFCRTQKKSEKKYAVLGYPGTSKMKLPPKGEHTFRSWHRTPKRYQKYSKNASFWAQFAPFGRPRAAFGSSWGLPKILRFLGGVQMLPSHENVSFWEEVPEYSNSQFGYLFGFLSKRYS